ncbi:kinase-like domain-containing protein [Phyllosticta citribraziliensis]|uniref:Kinase-like domain-containing protein n=1 Tax=Phyllosticta citribraziliensis TaxID=989973 RepID=A0ABR1M5Y4_9PEZI
MGWLRLLVPSILLPTFTWPHRLTSSKITNAAPSLQTPTPRWLRLLVGLIHTLLSELSMRYYCRWLELPVDNQIMQLPFGLVLKWSDGTQVEEVLATKMARAAGLPVPRIISYGEHPDTPHAVVSILMTRLPGEELGQVYDKLSQVQREAVLEDLKSIFSAIRKWHNPWGGTRICSPSGAGIRSVRVPHHQIPPCENKDEFIDFLLQPKSKSAFDSVEDFETGLAAVKSLRSIPHKIVFSHGDLKHHNIMVHRGRVSGIIDWESAGWYPEFWDFTTARRVCRKEFWWYDFVAKLGGSEYEREQDIESSLTQLTIDSFTW